MLSLPHPKSFTISDCIHHCRLPILIVFPYQLYTPSSFDYKIFDEFPNLHLLCSNSNPVMLVTITLLIGVFVISKGSTLFYYMSHFTKIDWTVSMVTWCAPNLASHSKEKLRSTILWWTKRWKHMPWIL